MPAAAKPLSFSGDDCTTSFDGTALIHRPAEQSLISSGLHHLRLQKVWGNYSARNRRRHVASERVSKRFEERASLLA
ncbi:hypothetical protein R69746_08551 [Paraburkholderia aspalathi]|nr:hypothetical protein R69746_08551 [Paraburkholderia aspalathi]